MANPDAPIGDVPEFRDGVPLILPRRGKLVLDLAGYTIVGLILNSVFAFLATLPFNSSAGVSWVWTAVQPVLADLGLEQSGSVFVFGIMAALAAVMSALGPIHSIHDRAIKFLHNVELCDRLATEILSSTYAGPRTDRTSWATNVNASYKGVRWWGKFALGSVVLFVSLAIAIPWVVALAFFWNTSSAVIAVVLFALVIIGDALEVRKMIWPGTDGLLLGEGATS